MSKQHEPKPFYRNIQIDNFSDKNQNEFTQIEKILT